MAEKLKKIIFYSESEIYGGHESMSLDHIKAGYSPDLNISILFNENNKRFLSAITNKGLDGLVSIVPIKFRYRRVPFLSLLLNYKLIGPIFDRKNPDVVVILQGNPDSSLLGTLLSKINKIRTYSYIPIPQKLSYTGGKFPTIRDFMVEKFMFPLFDRIITISVSLKKCLIERGVASSKISVVKNSVEIRSFPSERKKKLKQSLGLHTTDNIILLPGRIYFKQKGQDKFIQELSAINKSKKFKYVIAGDGPDFEDLKLLIKQNNQINKDIIMLGWCNNIDELISISDAVVLPSLFEGVPLVMLEALSQGKIVLASKRDGMKDYLPENWLFDINLRGDFANLINNMDLTYEILRANTMKDKFILENNRQELGKCFIDSIISE